MFVLEDFLPFRLSVLSQSVSRLIEKVYGERYGLSMNQWRCLILIASHPSITAREISDKALLDKMTVSRSVRALLKRNLVSRQSSHTDGRQQHLEITPIGQEIYMHVIPLARNYEAKLLEHLSNEEHISLCKTIDKLQTACLDLQEDQNKTQT